MMNFGKSLTYYQITRVLLVVWDNLLTDSKGAEELTRFHGVSMDLYYGNDLVGTGMVGDYRPPPAESQGVFGNASALAVATV